jgi:developmental checkpoint coupling sporulation initiation to replication initiation
MMISDELLIEAYKKAIKLKLDCDFISLLEIELKNRSLFEEVTLNIENYISEK